MAAGISIHVVDVSRGVVATGMRVEVFRSDPRRLLADASVGGNGVVDANALAATMTRGYYEAIFHVGDYYRLAGIVVPAIPFLEVVAYRFGIDRSDQHYHLPMKVTPWGYSCFRGGA